MEKSLSLILASLLLLSFVTACGDGNAPKKTTAQTEVTETMAPAETEVPASAPINLTENGLAKAHIVLSPAAHEWEKLGAEELRNHIQLVSGAEITVSDTKVEGSLPVFIGTPDSIPELEALFFEDLAWLRDVGADENYKRYGTDGFAVRQANNAVYIFGATPRGALNGVYDFIEENLGITLLPQAGVALGMAISAATLPNGELARNVVLFAVLVYELVGPMLTKISLTRAGDIKPEERDSAREAAKKGIFH